MAEYSQAGRLIAISTPLGEDMLLLESFTAVEAVSELFCFKLNLLGFPTDPVAFDGILGQSATIRMTLADDTERYFNGIVTAFSEAEQVLDSDGAPVFVRHHAELRPSAWLLTRSIRSRIFQQKTVPAILQEVFAGLAIANKIQGTFEPRDYCVQYRESDFAFAARLMEEEGIYYFFTHANGSHQMVLTNAVSQHPSLPESIEYAARPGGNVPTDQVTAWLKTQALRSGKITLWDHHFELPDQNLQAQKTVSGTVAIGEITHKLQVGGNDRLEIYDYPGDYAKRFAGVDPGGADKAADLQKIFQDNVRTTELRAQQETAPGFDIAGVGNCRVFYTGAKFTLVEHFDANGDYILTRVEWDVTLGSTYVPAGKLPASVANRFRCLPAALPFRPPAVTPRPFIDGVQTAVVVGPSGQEIFADKYGRVKVQFHWHREGAKDASSSCWVRVATAWAGKQWGMIHLPRIGQEVVIAFLDGDPDRPLIVGSVYNAAMMPPYALTEADNRTIAGLKSRSSLQGTEELFNELRFQDKKDAEDVYFHAQLDFHRVVERDDDLKVGRHQTIYIENNRTETIKKGNDDLTIEEGNRVITLTKGDETEEIKDGARTHKIKKDDSLTIEGKQTVEVTGDAALTISQGNYTVKVSAGKIAVEAAQSIELKVGGASVKIEPAGITLTAPQIKLDGSGQVEIKGAMVKVEGSGMTQVKGAVVQVSGDGMATVKGGVVMVN